MSSRGVLRDTLERTNTNPASLVDASRTPTIQETGDQSLSTIDLNLSQTRSDVTSNTPDMSTQTSTDIDEQVPLNDQGQNTPSSGGHISTPVGTAACDDPFWEPPSQISTKRPVNHPKNHPIKFEVPEPGSLQHAIISNPRKKLYVRPHKWTSEHLNILNVTVEVLPKEKYLSQTPISLKAFARDNNIQTTDQLKNYVRGINSSFIEIPDKDERMNDIFNSLMRWLTKDKDCQYRFNQDKCDHQNLRFNYKGVKKAKLICQSVVNTENKILQMAYVDKACLEQNRYQKLRGMGKYSYETMQKKHPTKYLLLGEKTPDTSIDPYYVGEIIAMAQHYIASCRAFEEKEDARTFYLCTPSGDRKSFVVYKAHVHPDFVKKFEEPYKNFDEGLVITREEYPIGMKTAFISALAKILDFPQDKINEWASIEKEAGSSSDCDANSQYVYQSVETDLSDSELNSSDSDVHLPISTDVSPSKAGNFDEILGRVTVKRQATEQEDNLSTGKMIKVGAETFPVPAAQEYSPEISPPSAPLSVNIVDGEHVARRQRLAKLSKGIKDGMIDPTPFVSGLRRTHDSPVGLQESTTPISTLPSNVVNKEQYRACENLRLLIKEIKSSKVTPEGPASVETLQPLRSQTPSPESSPQPSSSQHEGLLSLSKPSTEGSEREHEATLPDSPSSTMEGETLQSFASPPPSPAYSPISTPPDTPSLSNKRKAGDPTPHNSSLHKRVKREATQETITASAREQIQDPITNTTAENLQRILNAVNSRTSSPVNVQSGEHNQGQINISTTSNINSVSSPASQTVDGLGSTILGMLVGDNRTPLFSQTPPTTSRLGAESVLPGGYTPIAPQPASDLLASLSTPQFHSLITPQSHSLSTPQSHHPTPIATHPASGLLASLIRPETNHRPSAFYTAVDSPHTNFTPGTAFGPQIQATRQTNHPPSAFYTSLTSQPTNSTPGTISGPQIQPLFPPHYTSSSSTSQFPNFNNSISPPTVLVTSPPLPGYQNFIILQPAADLLASLITPQTQSQIASPQNGTSSTLSTTNNKRKREDDDTNPQSPKRQITTSQVGVYHMGLF